MSGNVCVRAVYGVASTVWCDKGVKVRRGTVKNRRRFNVQLVDVCVCVCVC